MPTKSYVDSLHDENERNRKDLALAFYDEGELTNLDSVTVNRDPSSDNELSRKIHIGKEIDKNTFSRFIQTLENYLKLSVGNDTYNLTKYYKIPIMDTTFLIKGNGQYLLPRWKIICNYKNNIGVTTNFIRATKANSPTSESGATSSPPVGSAFMYIKISSNIHSSNVFVSWEKTDIVQITNITFYCR